MHHALEGGAVRMHPTGAASLPAAPEAEVQAMHSMDWLFKKERIYLLAQFWQQVIINLIFMLINIF